MAGNEGKCVDFTSFYVLMQHFPLPGFLIDRCGFLMDWNERMARLTGFRDDDVMTKHCREILRFTGADGRHHEDFYMAVEEIHTNTPAVIDAEGLHLSTSAGRRIPVKVSLLPLKGVDGISAGALGIVTDLTVHRDLRLLKKEFLSLISHDLKNPLAMIQTYSEMLKDSIKESTDERLFLDQILLASSLLQIELNNIVNTGRLINGVMDYDMDTFNLTHLVLQTVHVLEPQVRLKEIDFRSDVQKELYIRGDAIKIQEVLINLLTNALRFTPKKGQVELSVGRHEEMILFAVKDGGKGIPASECARLMEAFEKGTEERSGIGLGLFIISEFLKAHQSELVIESRAGEGTMCSFQIPCAVMGQE